MELFDLSDYDLIAIFNYLDYHSQLDAMLVCRRFEALIGQNVQFHKNYKLKIYRKHTSIRDSQSTSEDGPAPKKAKFTKFMYFGRYFGDVTLGDYNFNLGSQYFPPLLETLETIGSKIDKLAIKHSQGYRDPVLEVLQLANNVKELTLYGLTINPYKISTKYKEIDIKKCTFPELRSLELSSVTNFETIKEAFDSVVSLHHFKLNNVNLGRWAHIQEILFRREHKKYHRESLVYSSSIPSKEKKGKHKKTKLRVCEKRLLTLPCYTIHRTIQGGYPPLSASPFA